MAAKLNIPKELQGTFNQLMASIPEKLRKTPNLQETTLVFLKLGGENLARYYIEINKIRLREKLLLNERLLREEALRDTSESDAFEFRTSGESETSDRRLSDSDDPEDETS